MHNSLTTNTPFSSQLGPVDSATVMSSTRLTDARHAVHPRMAAVIFFFRKKS